MCVYIYTYANFKVLAVPTISSIGRHWNDGLYMGNHPQMDRPKGGEAQGRAETQGANGTEPVGIGFVMLPITSTLVVWNHGILWLSIHWEEWSQLTNSYFSEGLKPPTRTPLVNQKFDPENHQLLEWTLFFQPRWMPGIYVSLPEGNMCSPGENV